MTEIQIATASAPADGTYDIKKTTAFPGTVVLRAVVADGSVKFDIDFVNIWEDGHSPQCSTFGPDMPWIKFDDESTLRAVDSFCNHHPNEVFPMRKGDRIHMWATFSNDRRFGMGFSLHSININVTWDEADHLSLDG